MYIVEKMSLGFRDIVLGRCGENNVLQIRINIQGLIDKFGEGNAVLVHKRSMDSVPYLVPIERDGSEVVWTVTSGDTNYEGVGECEIRWLVDDAVAKTIIYKTIVRPSLTGESTPQPPHNWYDMMIEYLNDHTVTDVAVISLPSGSEPTVVYEDGLVTFGIPAGDKGEKGDKGDTGAKGDKGDTGSQGAKGDQGEKGDKGDQGIQGEKGDTGATGAKGDKGDQGEKGDKGDTGAQGVQGETGNGIASVEKTGTQGGVDTYTITMTDGSTATFTVTNGEDIGARAEIDQLKNALTFNSSVIKNTETVYPLLWENGTLSNGEPVASGWAVRSPDFIEMTDGLTFTAKNIQSGLRLYMEMYDSTKTFITSINVEVGTLTPTNENCKYIKLFTYSETTPQTEQGAKISATITNSNSIESISQTMENNKTEAFDYTSWIVNGGVLAYKKSLTVDANTNNDGDATYIYNLLVHGRQFTGALIVYCESSVGSKLGSPIQIHVMDENQSFIKTVTFKAGVYPHVYVPASNEKYFDVVLYASGDGNLSNPAVFKNVFIAMNGNNIPSLNSAISPSYRSVPDYYLANDYLPNKVETVKNLINASDGNYDAFVFCTDQHWTLNAKKSPNLINYLMYNLKMPRLFMGGDYGSGINLQAINAFRDAYDGEIVNVTGNHEMQQYYQTEDGVVSGTVTGTMVWAYLDASMTDCVIGNAERNYYYIDNTQQKMRYIVLNDWAKGVSDSTPIYQFEQDQIDWFGSALQSLPDGYLAVVFIHAISSVNHGTGALTKNYAFNAVQTVVDAYSTKVCCIIAGHTHFDGVGATDGGVPIIITTCDKALPEVGYDDDLTDIRHIGTITEQAFDVIIINKKDKVINAVRIGCPANNPTGSPLEVRTVTYGS